MKGFASDNNSGVSPAILSAIAEANVGHEKGYGDDQYTEAAKAEFKTHFGSEIEVYFTTTGTGSNTLAIGSVAMSFHSIICADTAHINVDECGSPERLTGCKLVSVPTPNGKLTPDLVRPYLHGFGVCHHSQPKLISITQVTELGTLYSAEEIKALADIAHEYKMLLHVDGARISNAAASLNLPLKSFITDAGVDVLSFGGTKNGMLMGEAVILFRSERTTTAFEAIEYCRKQNAQLFSKMRYVGAQFKAFFQEDLWLKNARHANSMATLLADRVGKISGIEITQEVQANGLFAIIPISLISKLQDKFFFYTWDYNRGEVRWMTSFDTTEEEVNSFADLIEQEMALLK